MQIGIFGLLGLLFVALKLTDVIAWSWWLVTLPFWGGFLVAFLVYLIVLYHAVANASKR